MKDLPPAVQKAAREHTKNATLVGMTKEVEGGKTLYEVETKVNGKSCDVLLDQNGGLVETEEEVDLNSLPVSAKEAILQKLAGRKLKKVEAVTQGSSVSYEVSYAGKLGKTSEFAVSAPAGSWQRNCK